MRTREGSRGRARRARGSPRSEQPDAGHRPGGARPPREASSDSQTVGRTRQAPASAGQRGHQQW
eukprot:1072366-Alexandrium_andersonii.AAC.1